MTALTIRVEKIGLKDAGQCIDPYITVSVKGEWRRCSPGRWRVGLRRPRRLILIPQRGRISQEAVVPSRNIPKRFTKNMFLL